MALARPGREAGWVGDRALELTAPVAQGADLRSARYAPRPERRASSDSISWHALAATHGVTCVGS